MEMLAKDHMVLPIADQLIERYGDDLLVVAYMNTSGPAQGPRGPDGRRGLHQLQRPARGALAAREQGKKIFFVPDQHLGRNVADQLGMDPASLLALPGPGHVLRSVSVGGR